MLTELKGYIIPATVSSILVLYFVLRVDFKREISDQKILPAIDGRLRFSQFLKWSLVLFQGLTLYFLMNFASTLDQKETPKGLFFYIGIIFLNICSMLFFLKK